MSSEQKRAAKRKKRAEVARSKVATRREVLRRERRQAAEDQAKERQAHEIVHGKPVPIFRDPERAQAFRDDLISGRLAQNLKLLEALEREHDAELSAKRELSEKLTAEGHVSLKQKMDALHDKALELTGKAGPLAEATREYDRRVQENGPGALSDAPA